MSRTAPKSPPNKDEKNAADNALAACPFLAKGKPSITVAWAETEPGTPIKTAGKVSEVATTDNNPIIIAIPEIGSIPKTNGSNNDNPTVPPNPGITPTTKPIKTPRIKKKIEGPETIVANAANNASNMMFIPYKKKGGMAPFFLIIVLKFYLVSFHDCKNFSDLLSIEVAFFSADFKALEPVT